MNNILLFAVFIILTISGKAQTVTDADGNIYNTVTIGTQVWMKENLKTTKFNDGSIIPFVTNNDAWPNATNGAYTWYYNDEAKYKATYGALYNWYAIETGKLSPAGWHIPSDKEWATLIDFLGGINVAGRKLKETGTTHWKSLNSEATNASGFTALPGSYRNSDGRFGDIGFKGYWWSASKEAAYYAWDFSISGDISNVTKDFHYIDLGFSVRCIKDLSTSVSSFENSDEAFFIPNPSNGIIYLKAIKTSNSIITIYNLQGQEVFYKNVDSNSIDISKLIQGIYIIKLVNSNNIYTNRLIKN